MGPLLITKNSLLLSLLVSVAFSLFLACQNPVLPDSDGMVIRGAIQKGPFLAGTSIVIQTLDDNFTPTGQAVSIETTDNRGEFELEIMTNAGIVEITAVGTYFDEVSGRASIAPLTLRSVVDLSASETANVNVLTTLTRDRIMHLVTEEALDFTAAKQQAEQEVIAAFNIPWSDQYAGFQSMDLRTSNERDAVLLAVSAVLQKDNSTQELATLLSQIKDDIQTNGRVTSEDTRETIRKKSQRFDSTAMAIVRSNLEQRYSDLGIAVVAPEFEQFIDSSGNSIINRFTVARPQLSTAGGEYTNYTSVSISIETEGATLYYTLDGTTPSPDNGFLYSDPIVISRTKTLRAVATKDGYNSAFSETAHFTMNIVTEPEDGGFSSSALPSFEWNEQSDVKKYELRISLTPEGLEDAEVITVPTHSFQLDRENHRRLTRGETYYWQVRAVDETGTERRWSIQRSFEVPTIQSVASGSEHSMILDSTGTLWGTGSNSAGQLGDGTTTNRSTPVKIMDNVAAVSAGLFHTMFIKADGTLWGMGRNSIGQIGDGTATNRSTPVKIMENVAIVSAGSSHTMFIRDDGTLWGTGDNFYGQLGYGTVENLLLPEKITANVAIVSAGGSHTMFIKNDGTLWGTGGNSYGQLGDGTRENRSEPREIKEINDFISVSAGGLHTMFIRNDDNLKGSGGNYFGQLGNYTQIVPVRPGYAMDDVDAVSAGYQHTMFIQNDGTLWGTGWNQYGQLGDGTTPYHLNGEIITDNVALVSAGSFHTIFIRNDGTLWGMGWNQHGELGDGTTETQPYPIEIIW